MSERSKEWERIVKKQAESGLTAAEYCRSHGLDVQQFYYRSRIHRKRALRAVELQASCGSGSERIPPACVCKCPRCESSIEAAPMPETPIKGVQVESCFLAYIVSQKYEYGMPYYRVADLLSSKGLPMSRTTLCEYSDGTGRVLAPLLAELEACLQSGAFFHADETSWEVA